MAFRPEYRATFHIWETQTGDEEGNGTTVGHSSIDLEGEGNGRYWSFRPRNSFFVNPLLAFFPTFGKSEASLDSDIQYEGKTPDRSFEVALTREQHDAMAAEVDTLTERANAGKLLYHLFPNASVLSPAKLLATRTAHQEMGKCPFSEQKMGDDRDKSFSGLLEVEEGHCASTVHQIASRAFVLPAQDLTPWGIHPSQLGNQLDRVIEE